MTGEKRKGRRGGSRRSRTAEEKLRVYAESSRLSQEELGAFLRREGLHETAGHDILHADNGLQAEIADGVRRGLERDQTMRDAGLPDYWADRIDETASDVMGILNMGPAAGIGLVGYFRGLNAAFGGSATLRADGPSGDPHPADLLRGYLAARIVEHLRFDGAQDWARAIERETEKDAPQSRTIRLAGINADLEVAAKSAALVANVVATSAFEHLEHHALLDIQDWRNNDEAIVAALGTFLTTAGTPDPALVGPFYAAHVVAAAVTLALRAGADIPLLFTRMQGLLKVMHDQNPSWGPLFVRHPGDLFRDLHYVPAPQRQRPFARARGAQAVADN